MTAAPRLALAAVLLAGCALWGGGAEDDVIVCGAPAPADPGTLRNPDNGGCESFGDGCRGIPLPDWAACGDPCEQLAEDACLSAPRCRAVYSTSCAPGGPCPADAPITFLACWGTAPASTTEGGTCDGLDAFGCSQHDDCAARYDVYEVTDPLAQLLSFSSCIAEPVRTGGR
jgi:hypothetical protein